jgi:gamma-glutamyl:cysteine ligase YbdK (ATP-grasp superfamily)
MRAPSDGNTLCYTFGMYGLVTMFRYRLGIEEEYFVVDRKTRNVRHAMPRKFFRACKIDLKDRVTTELLQSQIEVSTLPCTTMAEALTTVADGDRSQPLTAGEEELARSQNRVS